MESTYNGQYYTLSTQAIRTFLCFQENPFYKIVGKLSEFQDVFVFLEHTEVDFTQPMSNISLEF